MNATRLRWGQQTQSCWFENSFLYRWTYVKNSKEVIASSPSFPFCSAMVSDSAEIFAHYICLSNGQYNVAISDVVCPKVITITA